MSGADGLRVDIGGRIIRGDDSGGDGPAVIALHGLTATRRYVVHGSRALERAGYRVIAYDSRGHGSSDPAEEPTAYAYDDLRGDLVAVMDALDVPSAVLVGHSMGGHLAAALAIAAPDRVSALVIGAPAHLGRPTGEPERWDRLADGLARGGPEGLWAALDHGADAEWNARVETVVLQRLRRHEHPEAVVDALRSTPRSAAFNGIEALAHIRCPTLVVGSQDRFDPDHPEDVARRYAATIPGSRFVIEQPGAAPLTWRGGALSAEILAFLADCGLNEPGAP